MSQHILQLIAVPYATGRILKPFGGPPTQPAYAIAVPYATGRILKLCVRLRIHHATDEIAVPYATGRILKLCGQFLLALSNV